MYRRILVWLGFNERIMPWAALGALLGVLFAAILVVAILDAHKRGAITLENYDRIHLGMTEKEVDNLLGRPHVRGTTEGLPGTRGVCVRKIWYGDKQIINVAFENGLVVEKKPIAANWGYEPGFFERLRQTLSW